MATQGLDAVGDGAAAKVAVVAVGLCEGGAPARRGDEGVEDGLEVEGGAGEALGFAEGPDAAGGDEVDVRGGGAGGGEGRFEVEVEEGEEEGEGGQEGGGGGGPGEGEEGGGEFDGELAAAARGVGEGVVGGEGPEAVVFGGVGVAGVDVDREAAARELAGEVFEEGGGGGVAGVAAAEEDGELVAEEEVW